MQTASKIHRLSPDHRKLIMIGWIATATELLIEALPGQTKADVDLGIEHAIDLFVHDHATPGSAIPQGVAFARQRIKRRRDQQLARDFVMQFLKQQRQRLALSPN